MPQNKITPQQQLWKLTTAMQHKFLRETLCCLRPDKQEDLCIALVAYIRFGIVREFENIFMMVLFEGLRSAIDEENAV